MTAIAVIPARLESTRFPGKVLASDTGLPLIIHVARQAARVEALDDVIIASDAPAILEVAQRHGFTARKTRADHPNGTSRIAEIAPSLGSDLIVNVQADEPELDPAVITAAIDALVADPACQVGTIASEIVEAAEAQDPNVVKVVVDRRQRALYFSRSPVPADQDGEGVTRLRHVGLYVYRRDFLPIYASLTPTPAEVSEKLEQLRMLEHGHRIAVAVRESHHQGIDTPEQYRAFVERYCSANPGEGH